MAFLIFWLVFLCCFILNEQMFRARVFHIGQILKFLLSPSV